MQMKENIIAGIVIIVLVVCFAIFNILTEKGKAEYFSVVGQKRQGFYTIYKL